MGRSNLRICLGNLVAMRVAVILTLDQPLSFFRIAFRSDVTRTTVAEHAIAFVGLNKLEVLANKLLFATAANERDSNNDNEDHCRKRTSNRDANLLGHHWAVPVSVKE